MQDGKNLFFPEEAFAGTEWRVDETMDRLDQMNAIRKAIVVGVHPADRMKDYTRPGYESYGRFLVETLKPTIDATYRTRPGREDTVVVGSSLGGVVSLYMVWHHADVFGRAACLSSTFGVFDDLFSRIASEPRRDILLYLDSGWPRDNYDATNAMRDLLLARGFRLGVDLLQFSAPEGLHSEASWAARLHIPFQFFFGRAWLAQRGEIW
jgi:predicted alpha/beta superfamily hydrolase